MSRPRSAFNSGFNGCLGVGRAIVTVGFLILLLLAFLGGALAAFGGHG